MQPVTLVLQTACICVYAAGISRDPKTDAESECRVDCALHHYHRTMTRSIVKVAYYQ